MAVNIAHLPTEILAMVFEQADKPTLQSLRLSCASLSGVATRQLFEHVVLFTRLESLARLCKIAKSDHLRNHVRKLTYASALLLGSKRFQAEPDDVKYDLPAFEHWKRSAVGMGMSMNARSRADFLDQFTEDELRAHYTHMRRASWSQEVVIRMAEAPSHCVRGLDGRHGPPPQDYPSDYPSIDCVLAGFTHLERLAIDPYFNAREAGGRLPRAAHEWSPGAVTKAQLAKMHPITQQTLQCPHVVAPVAGSLQVFNRIIQAHVHAGFPSRLRALELVGLRSVDLPFMQPGFMAFLNDNVALEELTFSQGDAIQRLPGLPNANLDRVLASTPALKSLVVRGDGNYTSAVTASNDAMVEFSASNMLSGSPLLQNRWYPNIRTLSLVNLILRADTFTALLPAAAPHLRHLRLANLNLECANSALLLSPEPNNSWGAAVRFSPSAWARTFATLKDSMPALESLGLEGSFLAHSPERAPAHYREVHFDAAEPLHPSVRDMAAWKAKLVREILRGECDSRGSILQGGRWPWMRRRVGGGFVSGGFGYGCGGSSSGANNNGWGADGIY